MEVERTSGGIQNCIIGLFGTFEFSVPHTTDHINLTDYINVILNLVISSRTLIYFWIILVGLVLSPCIVRRCYRCVQGVAKKPGQGLSQPSGDSLKDKLCIAHSHDIPSLR